MSIYRFASGLIVVVGLAAACGAARADTPSTTAQRIATLEGEMAQARASLQVAQLYNRPPGSIPNVAQGQGYAQGQGQDQSDLELRVDHLESQMRDLTGQIQQMQFDLNRVQTDMQKFEQDVDFRFQDAGRGAAPAASPAPVPGRKRGDAGAPTGTDIGQLNGPAAPAAAQGPVARNDAFDPTTNPDAIGAPRVLGTLPSSDAAAAAATGPAPTVIPAPIPGNSGVEDGQGDDQPLNLLPSVARDVPSSAGPSPVLNAPAAVGPAPILPAATPTVLASLPPTDPHAAFDQAMAAYNQNSYDAAESSFRTFLAQYPKDKLVPDAIFYLGETFYKRNRPREAAEQYLKISTDYSKSARAPAGLLRLGQSLALLGAKDQACAAFAEVERKYPNAPADVRLSSDREAKRAQC